MITPKDIIQIDATVLAGLLILLTVISLSVEPSFEDSTIRIIEIGTQTGKTLTDLTFDIQQKESDLKEKENQLFESQDALNEVLTDMEIKERKKELEKEIEIEFDKFRKDDPSRSLTDLANLELEEKQLRGMLYEKEELRRKPYLDKVELINSTVVILQQEIEQMKQTRTKLITNSMNEINSIKETLQLEKEQQIAEEEASLLKKT